jgi:hypothetical protein
MCCYYDAAERMQHVLLLGCSRMNAACVVMNWVAAERMVMVLLRCCSRRNSEWIGVVLQQRAYDSSPPAPRLPAASNRNWTQKAETFQLIYKSFLTSLTAKPPYRIRKHH